MLVIHSFQNTTLTFVCTHTHTHTLTKCQVSGAEQVVGGLSHGTANDGPRTVSGSDLVLDEVGNMIDAGVVGKG